MKKYWLAIVCFLFIVFSADYGYAQINRKMIRKNNKRIAAFKGKKTGFQKNKRYNYFGVSINSFNYFGDLSPLSKKLSTDISFTRPGVGVFYGHRFGPRYTLRGAFTYGTLRGDDFTSADPNDEDARYRYVRNLQFRNRVKELTVTAMFDLFENQATYISRVQFTPYAYLGFTVFHHNPQALVGDDSGLPEAGEWIDLQPLGTEGQHANLDPTDANAGLKPYSKIQLAIPFGIGARYRLNQVMDLSFEMGIRYTFTDYLDDVSGSYVDPGVFGDDELARYLSDRSLEVNAAEGDPRDLSSSNIAEIYNNRNTFVGRDGQSYERIRGFGQESPGGAAGEYRRGNNNDNDLYFVTSIKVSFIIGSSFNRAKFR